MVLADRGRGLVQEVAADMGDAGVNLLDADFRLLPVAAELLFVAHAPLVPGEPYFLLSEGVGWFDKAPIGQGREVGDAHVDADDAGGRMHRLFDFSLGLDRHEPFTARLAHRDIAQRAQHVPAEADPQPAQLGQEDSAVGLIEFDLLRVGVAEAVVLAFFLEAREVGAFQEEVFVRFLQILQGLLQRVARRILEPWRIRAVAPGRQMLGHRHVADELVSGLVICFLQRQRFVQYEAT